MLLILLGAIFIMLLLMLVQVIVGVVSVAARPEAIADFENPSLNNVPDLGDALRVAEFNEVPKEMIKKHLSKRNITCNDGSPSGFFYRPAMTSNRWIVYLEGGWYCYDQRSCHDRWMNHRHLMSSKLWPATRTVGGILSSDPSENPLYWNAHHVLIPYCTSDIWSGTRKHGIAGSRFSFLGAKVIRQVILDLVPLGLTNASSILLVGSSAGGTGVLLNLNSVQSLVHIELERPNIPVRGMADSGWFLDREPYVVERHSTLAVDAISQGIPLWHGKVPPLCAAQYPYEPWRCFFGYRIYPFLKAPLFVFQWLFDEAQMAAENVGTPVTKHQWDYIHKMGDSLRYSFQNVSAVFAPSCIGHCVLTKSEWHSVKINEVSLPEALRCWELSLEPSIISLENLYLSALNSSLSTTMLSDSPLVNGPAEIYRTVDETTTKAPERKRRRKHHKKKLRQEQKGNGRKKRRGHGRKNKNRLMRSPFVSAVSVESTPSHKQPACRKHHIDRCSWPQCNLSCPKLNNPFTGEEMDFIELLKSFGLDMESVANALGVDIVTLNNMDHDELLRLLTQQNN